MKHQYLKRVVLCAMFAALCCLATVVVQIPAPLVGYLNLGDCVVLSGAFLLGPWYGALAAGIGSALADLLSGYVQYVPATFVIKWLVAMVAGLVFAVLRSKITHFPAMRARFVSAVLGECVMVFGYFAYEAFLLGYGMAALGGMPFNLIQAALGIVVSLLLCTLLLRIPGVKRHFFEEKE